jgi:transposase
MSDLTRALAIGRSARTDCSLHFTHYSTCYNRFVRWRRAGGWSRVNALAGAHDAAVQMIDTSIVRVHQHGACMTCWAPAGALAGVARPARREAADYSA